MSETTTNLNESRSQATRARLIDAATASLIEVGYHQTTGVGICARAGMTRGALNHHFSDLPDLLVEVLRAVYARLNDVEGGGADLGAMQSLVARGKRQIKQPEFKAVIELWLASRNDEVFGRRVADAMEEGSVLFSPAALCLRDDVVDQAAFTGTYWTIFEAMIGLGLGRTVSSTGALAHEEQVWATLQDLASRADELQASRRKDKEVNRGKSKGTQK